VVTVSLGAAAMIPDEGQTPQDLIQAADQALYRAKDGGRNRVEAAETISVLEASEV
jgi:diguanylate cyclase (GGDEF)-like protein